MTDFIQRMKDALAAITGAPTEDDRRRAERVMARIIQEAHEDHRKGGPQAMPAAPRDWKVAQGGSDE